MNRHSSYSAPRSERSSGSYSGQRGRSSRRNTYNKHSWKDNRTLFNLVCFVLPFIIINLIILFLAVSTPKIEYNVSDTQDYKTVVLTVKVRSLLPIKEMAVSLETKPLEMSKEKGVYTATLAENGTLEIYVTGWNGMSNRIYDHVATLDDAPPTINEEDYIMEGGQLIIHVSDSQSGVNFEAAYATDENGQTIKPLSTAKDTGGAGTGSTITFPMESSSLTVYIEDYAGNTFKASFTTRTEGIDTSNRNADLALSEPDGSGGDKSSGSSTKEGSGSKETTKAAKETTKAAKETTKAAKETTKAAKETTKAAKETTKAAKETTKAAKETTKAATETSKSSTETSKAAASPENPTASEDSGANSLTPSQAPGAPAGPGGASTPTQSPSASPTQDTQPISPTSESTDIVVVPVS